MGIVWTAIVGLVVGAIARFIMPGGRNMGWILTIALGIGGSVLAGFVGKFLGWYGQGQGAGIIASVIGALVLLFVVGKLQSGSGTKS